MHLYQEAVGSYRDRTAAQHFYEVSSSATLTWVDNDGEVGLLFSYRHRCQIQRVTGVSLKRPNTSLAEQDVGIACERIYSAAKSHSSIRSLIPRFSRIG